ncbi:hypothetical protein [Rhizobium sp. OK494]|uniref:hypothetical protein n=1 Tax=Rhizobium sp. 11_C7_N12_5 TaxID=3240770 RepID=UPI0012E01D3B
MSNFEFLQKQYAEAVQEIALLRRVLYLVNESLDTNADGAVAEKHAEMGAATRYYRIADQESNVLEKTYVLELAKLMFRAGVIPSSEIFDESAYLSENPDVAGAIATRRFGSGFEHWLAHGLSEGRSAMSKVVSVDRLGEEVISAYRSYKIKRTQRTKSWLNSLLRFFTIARQRA